MRPEDVRVGDVYRRNPRIELADERGREFAVLAIEVDPENLDLGPMAVTCRPGAVDATGFEHGGVGCCGWWTTTIADDVNSGALVKSGDRGGKVKSSTTVTVVLTIEGDGDEANLRRVVGSLLDDEFFQTAINDCEVQDEEGTEISLRVTSAEVIDGAATTGGVR